MKNNRIAIYPKSLSTLVSIKNVTLQLKFLSISCLLILMFSCTKDRGIIETKLVVTKQDFSLPTNFDIVNFDFYSENNLFVVAYSGYEVQLFKSNNGGASWIELPNPVSTWNSSVDEVQSVVYMDSNNLAFVVDNKLYRSFDGGQNWVIIGEFSQSLRVFFADKTADGKLLFIENNGSTDNRVLTSSYDSPAFTQIGSCPTLHFYFNQGHLSENYITFLTFDHDYSSGGIYGYNLVTQTQDFIGVNMNAYNYPNDALMAKGNLLFVRKDGILNSLFGIQSNSQSNYYRYHSSDYYSAVDMGDYMVAVGDNTISTSINGEWEEALNIDGTGIQELFRKVKKIDADHFYVSGVNGTFFKATFK